MAATQSAKAASGRKNAMGGFIVDKLDEDVMNAFIKENDLSETLSIDDEMTAEQIGLALALHLKETVPPKKQVKCDNCLGISDADAPRCPFCGDDGTDDAPLGKKAPSKEEGEAIDAADEEEEDEDEEEEEDADIEENNAQQAAQALEEEDDGDEEEEEEEKPTGRAAAVTAKKTTKATKKKGSKNNMSAAASHVNGASKKSSSKSTALAKGTTGTIVSVKELDKARDEVIEIKSRGAQNFWELGKKLAEISKKQLWKLRLNADTGKNKYNGFDAFVIAELNMSPMHAYRAIEIAEAYKTSEEVRVLGTTKASLILQAAPEDRKKLAAKAKAGASKRALEKDVKKSRAKHGSPKKSQQAKAGAKGGAKRATTSAVKAEKISIASIEGSKTIKLYKKPESFKDVVFSKLPRAAKIGDMPVGRFEMGNGVVQYFAVRNGEEGLVLKIETRRETAE